MNNNGGERGLRERGGRISNPKRERRRLKKVALKICPLGASWPVVPAN
jgi:hypothetical protein